MRLSDHLTFLLQPALLYLVPMCLGGSVATALTLGDFKGLCAYDEEAANEAAKEKQKKENDTSKESESVKDEGKKEQ